MTQRLKVLVSAYACEPHTGSEPGVGWQWVRQIARFHEVWVITRANNRANIEAALTEDAMSGVHWVYYDLPRWARFWKKGGRGVQIYYYLWQIGIYAVARRLHRDLHFDLAHHLTFGNYWLPSLLPRLDIPFVWGPVGGAESAPRTFYATLGTRGRILEYIRDAVRWLSQWDPFVRLDIEQACVTLAKASETRERVKSLGARVILDFPEAGMSAEEIATLGAFPMRDTPPFRVASIGVLRHWKGFHLGLRAFAEIAQDVPDAEYWLIGNGPERGRLEQLACDLGISDRVRFWGQIPRHEVLERLAGCDVLLHPTLHDSGGWVSLEAMAAGRPVICLDLGGPAMEVTEETGFKIPPVSPRQAIEGLATALLQMARDTGLKRRMGEAGRKRVQEHFTWDMKGDRIAQIYDEVRAASRDRS